MGIVSAYGDFDNFLAWLTPEERLDAAAIAHEVLPLFAEACQHDPTALLDEVKSIVKVFGWRVLRVALGLTSEEVKVKILTAVFGILPKSLTAEVFAG